MALFSTAARLADFLLISIDTATIPEAPEQTQAALEARLENAGRELLPAIRDFYGNVIPDPLEATRTNYSLLVEYIVLLKAAIEQLKVAAEDKDKNLGPMSKTFQRLLNAIEPAFMSGALWRVQGIAEITALAVATDCTTTTPGFVADTDPKNGALLAMIQLMILFIGAWVRTRAVTPGYVQAFASLSTDQKKIYRTEVSNWVAPYVRLMRARVNGYPVGIDALINSDLDTAEHGAAAFNSGRFYRELAA